MNIFGSRCKEICKKFLLLVKIFNSVRSSALLARIYMLKSLTNDSTFLGETLQIYCWQFPGVCFIVAN